MMNKQQLIELTEQIKHSNIPKSSQEILLKLVDKADMLEHLEVFDKLYLEKCEEVNRLTKQLPVFSVGDTAYYVDVQEKKIEEVVIDLVIVVQKASETTCFYDGGILRFCNKDVGKILFADKKQAEKKLKKVKK